MEKVSKWCELLDNAKEPEGFLKLHHELEKNFLFIGPKALRGLSPEDREELFQEVCIAIINNISDHSSELGCLSWLRAIVHNKTVDYFRKMSRTTIGHEYRDEDFGVIDDSLEIRNELQNVFKELEETETNLLIEVKLFGRTFKEMALMTGKKQGALKVALHRALKKMNRRAR